VQWRRSVSPVKYELGFYIPEDDILHSHRRKNLKFYIKSSGTTRILDVIYRPVFYLKIRRFGASSLAPYSGGSYSDWTNTKSYILSADQSPEPNCVGSTGRGRQNPLSERRILNKRQDHG
jgi:hypothetical protein